MSTPIAQLTLSAGLTLTLYQGDLTEEAVDAIVNAANEHLAHGGGLAGAIVRKGGWQIQTESDEWVRKNGQAGHAKPALTRAGSLPCQFIIHAVGPVWGSGDEDVKLRTAYTAGLQLAHAQGFTSIAFPSLSTGIFGFPVERAAPIAVQAVMDFCAAHPDTLLRDLRFTLIDAPTVEVFKRAFERRTTMDEGRK
ncbi:MAG: macro domain-containing protein [Anaerolineales bacterium]